MCFVRKMKNRISIIILFVIQALPIPFALLAGFMLMFSLVSLVETDWSQFDVIIQSAAALTAMVIGAAYTITYFDSLKKTLDNKKLSFISFLPAKLCMTPLSSAGTEPKCWNC